MKKLLALLLALCLVFGLVACGGDTGDNTGDNTGSNVGDNAGNNGGEDAGNNGGEDAGNNGGEDAGNNGGENTGNAGSGSYAGKTLEIWAVTGEGYSDPEKINAKNWMYMVRAAMVEWADKNGVTLNFVSNYNQQNLTSALGAGDKPDFVMATEKFPEIANLGLVQAFTDAQVKKVTDVVGETWLQTYKGQVYGVLPPWAGAKLLRFNLTMLENYGIKTPYEYIAEGNWTWDAFFKICEEATKDTNGDGKLDTIGCSTFAPATFADVLKEGDDGKLSSNLESPEFQALAEKLYSAVVEKKWIITSDKMVTSMEAPRVSMCIQDCEPFNFMHTYQELINGDIIAACLPPAQTADADPRVEVTNYVMGIPMGSDESDAAVDMLCYILQAGIKFMADHSEGLMTTEYKGIEGSTDYTKAYVKAYNKWLKERDEEYEYMVDCGYDEEFYKTMLETYNKIKKTPGKLYSGVSTNSMITNPLLAHKGFEAMYKLPPASSMATLVPAYKALLDKYNTLFVS